MTTFCESVPNDPSCPPDPNSNGRSGADRNQAADGDLLLDELSVHMRANLIYLQVAFMLALHSGLKGFRYFSDENFSDGDVMGTNWWARTYKITKYTSFLIATVLTITQMLSMNGIA